MIPIEAPATLAADPILGIITVVIGVVVAYLSIDPIKNMISPQQRMNASFNPLHLVNTYGAFGSVTRTRHEIIIEGTTDEVINDNTDWKAYEFKGKPGNPHKIPRQWAPYHLRLDWQMWFAAMTSIRRNPWLIIFIQKLLLGDNKTLRLLSNNPFNDHSPNYIRARLLKYEFTSSQEYKETGKRWNRSFERMYISPTSLQDLSHLY
ncbi:lipase maturation factor family protein [Fodinibius sp. Rm-B-1B1-1]|uniref:lipase maturation factor family protein n=1 Tax=Fodinibius alkaliphilus TaxID=3140241 RepID=UPI0038B36531